MTHPHRGTGVCSRREQVRRSESVLPRRLSDRERRVLFARPPVVIREIPSAEAAARIALGLTRYSQCQLGPVALSGLEGLDEAVDVCWTAGHHDFVSVGKDRIRPGVGEVRAMLRFDRHNCDVPLGPQTGSAEW